MPADPPCRAGRRGRAAGSTSWPEVVEPEDWLDGEAAGREPSRLLGFGAGPRFCSGRNRALLEAKTALTVLAAHFELSLDPAAPTVQERSAFTTIPQGLRLRIRERSPAVS